MRDAVSRRAGRRAGWVFALTIGAVALAPAAARAEFERYTIDPEHVSIGFLVHHLGFADVLGMFLVAEGSFEYDAEAQAVRAVEISVQADSVFTNHDRRDGHLRSGDFLDIENHPAVTFTGTSVEQTGPETGVVHGDLTILGTALPASFDITLAGTGAYPFGDKHFVVSVSARGMVTRSAYGMTYGVDGGWVGDEIEVIVEFEAIREAE